MSGAGLLLVCTANRCRSPLAERLLAAALDGAPAGPFEVGSAGVAAPAGRPMDPHARQVLAERGVPAQGFGSRHLTADLVAGAGLVLAASREHRAAAVTLHPRASARTFTLRELHRLLGAVPAAEVTGSAPRERLAALTAAAARRRGVVVAARPADDDLADPVGGPVAAFRGTADALEELLQPLVELLCRPGDPLPAASRRAPAGTPRPSPPSRSTPLRPAPPPSPPAPPAPASPRAGPAAAAPPLPGS